MYDLRAAGDVLLTVAKAVPAAAKALPWADEVEFIKETITQLPPGANGGSAPDVLWSRFQQHGGWWPAQPQPVAAQLAPNAAPVQASLPPADGSPQEYPYNLHIYLSPLLSDGRGANQPWLQGSPDINTTIAWQTWVEINPATASKLGLKKGDVVKITSPYDSLEAEVYVYPGVRPDTVAIPLGQGHTDYGRYAQQRGANVMKLLNPRQNPQVTDLAYAGVHVKIEPTGKIKYVATFENTPGVEQGFPNQSIPGF